MSLLRAHGIAHVSSWPLALSASLRYLKSALAADLPGRSVFFGGLVASTKLVTGGFVVMGLWVNMEDHAKR